MYYWHCCRMRADRLLSLMLLLRRRGRMTAAALAGELECSVRTVLRDIEALSAAGVPVYAERGRHGGFALLGGYSTDLTGLTHAEATALFTAGSRATSTSLGMAPALASAMRKLVAAMPEPQRQSAERATERVLVQPGGWLDQPEPPGLLSVIQQAVFTDRRLKICYPSRGEAARWRTVDPVGLVHAAGRWYLLATSTVPTAPTGCPASPPPRSSTHRLTGAPASTWSRLGSNGDRPSARPNPSSSSELGSGRPAEASWSAPHSPSLGRPPTPAGGCCSTSSSPTHATPRPCCGTSAPTPRSSSHRRYETPSLVAPSRRCGSTAASDR